MEVSSIHLSLDEDDGFDGHYQLVITNGEIRIYQGATRIKIISIKNMIQLAVSQFGEEVTRNETNEI